MRNFTIIPVFGLLLLLSFTAFGYDDRPKEYPTYTAHVNEISIAYQDFGDPADDTILLIMGLGGQLTAWDDEMVLALVDAGYRVVRFDNRDIGWSEKFYDAPTPGWITGIRFRLGMSLNSPYKLDDMAADSYALLQYLQIDRAHVVGLSMGGMIAQIMAARYPDRVISLTSIMSTSSAEHLPQGTVQLSFVSDSKVREDVIKNSVELLKSIDGTSAPRSHQEWYKALARSYDRSHYADGTARQFWAIVDSGDRVELLKTITQPALVIHGKEDPLIPYQGGEHTAELIPGARLVLLESMGHYIDRISQVRIINEIVTLASTIRP